MKFSKKIIIVLLFVIGIAGLLVGSIAYYRIVVNGSITGSTGNAVFVLRDTEEGESWNNKVISLGKINPGDSGSFDVVMDASGSTVDIYATLNIDSGSGDTELPTNLKFYTTSDHKSELHKYYSFLEKNGTNKETLTVYWYWNPYISDEEDKKYVNKTFSTTINVNAVQISEYATMKNGYSSDSSANGGTEFWNNNYSSYIRTIIFNKDLSNLPSECNEGNLCWDISDNSSQNKKVYGYLVDSGLTISETDSNNGTKVNKQLYNLYIASEAPIFASSDCSNMFSKFENLKSIEFNNNFNTSNVTNMSHMFSDCSSLTSLDLGSFNTANVTNMVGMFYKCSSLEKLDLSSFNTSNVTEMNSMFNNCSSLTILNLSNFNTTNVTNMSDMFAGCSSLTSLNLSSFNTSNVTSMSYMFCNCSSLTSLDLSSFNTSNVTDMREMFVNCESLTSLDLSNFNTAKVTNMFYIFANCKSLTNLDLSNFNTSNVTNMECMFYNCSKLQTTINILNASTTYTDIFAGNALTDTNANVIIGYTAETKAIAEAMKETAGSNKSKITLKQI